MTLRNLAHRLSRNVTLKRRLPPELGSLPLYVTPAASLRLWRRDLATVAPTLLRTAADIVCHGDVIWDVGASVGLFSFAAAYRARERGLVMAFEPDPVSFGLLVRSSTERGKRAHVEVRNVAVSDRCGETDFLIARGGRSMSHLPGEGSGSGERQTGGTLQTVRVKTVTLDSVAENTTRNRLPSVLKIDVEGAEHLVLRGATRLFEKVKPFVIMEVEERNADEVGDFLLSRGYTLWDGDVEPRKRRELNRPVWNTIAFPPARG